IQLRRIVAIAPGENLSPKCRPDFAGKDAVLPEARESIRVQHLCPFIRVVPRAVTDRTPEEMSKSSDHRVPRREGRGAVLLKHAASERHRVSIAFLLIADMQ